MSVRDIIGVRRLVDTPIQHNYDEIKSNTPSLDPPAPSSKIYGSDNSCRRSKLICNAITLVGSRNDTKTVDDSVMLDDEDEARVAELKTLQALTSAINVVNERKSADLSPGRRKNKATAVQVMFPSLVKSKGNSLPADTLGAIKKSLGNR